MRIHPLFSFAAAWLLFSCDLARSADGGVPASVPGPVSDRFEVHAGDLQVPDIAYATFAFAGPVEIAIHAKDGPVRIARVQPSA